MAMVIFVSLIVSQQLDKGEAELVLPGIDLLYADKSLIVRVQGKAVGRAQGSVEGQIRDLNKMKFREALQYYRLELLILAFLQVFEEEIPLSLTFEQDRTLQGIGCLAEDLLQLIPIQEGHSGFEE